MKFALHNVSFLELQLFAEIRWKGVEETLTDFEPRNWMFRGRGWRFRSHYYQRSKKERSVKRLASKESNQ